jgi:hypothetical protein
VRGSSVVPLVDENELVYDLGCYLSQIVKDFLAYTFRSLSICGVDCHTTFSGSFLHKKQGQ